MKPCFASLLLLSPVAAQEPISIEQLGREALEHASPTVQHWAETWRSGDMNQVLAAVYEELAKEEPHPYTSFLWTSAQLVLDAELDVVVETLPDNIRPHLADAAIARGMFLDGRSHELLELYPIERIETVDDIAALTWLDSAADDQAAIDMRIALALRLIEVAPEDWWSVWNVAGIVGTDNRARLAFLDALAPSTDLGKTPAGQEAFRLASWAMIFDDRNAVRYGVLVTRASKWLETRPGDFAAEAFRGSYLRLQNYPEESVASLARASWLGPWRGYAERMSHELIDLDRHEDARTVFRVIGGYRGEELEWRLAEAYNDTGAPGYARPILEGLPNDARAARLLAEIELDVGRHEQALAHARRAHELDAEDLEVKETLVRALIETPEREEGWAIAASLLEDLRRGSASTMRGIVNAYTASLNNHGRGADVPAIYEKVCATWPESSWMLRNYAYNLDANGRHAEAIEVMRRSLEVQPWSSYAYGRLAAWWVRDLGQEAAVERMEALCTENYRAAGAWKALSAHLDTESELLMWSRASELNPGVVWPIAEMSHELQDIDAERSWTILRDAEVGERPVDRAFAAHERLVAFRYAWISERARIQDDLPIFWSEYEIGRELNCDQSTLHEQAWNVLEGEGKNEEAAQACLGQALCDFDRVGWTENLKHRGFPSHLGMGYVNSLLMRQFERNPYDAERVDGIAHYLSKWGGSPVEVARLAYHLREVQPDEYSSSRAKSELTNTYDKAGDHRTSFELLYSRDRAVSLSERYFLGWYEAARSKALGAEWARVEFDFEAGTMTTTRAFGPPEVRGYHPLSGRMTLAQRGSAWIRLSYADDYGELLSRMETSSGRFVTLEYDDEGKITRSESSEGEVVEFEYGADGEMSVARVVGFGELLFASGLGGAVEHNAIDPDADPFEVQMRVSAVFDETLALAERVGDFDLSGLQPDDSGRAMLEEALYDAEDYQGWVTASLELAAHLIESVDVSPEQANHAAGILADLWDPLTTETSEWDRERLPRLVELARSLTEARYPGGLPSYELEAWSDHRVAVRNLAIEFPEPAVQEALAKIDGTAFQIADEARWLPRSDLDNEAFWRGWQPSDLAPARRASKLRLQALHALPDGRLLAGTNLGLHVLDRGWWQWFVYDEELGRLVEGDASTQVSASSEVQGFAAPQHGGVLWIGTANGLLQFGKPLELDEDEEAPELPPIDLAASPTRFTAQSHGLPSPSIDHLAVFGTQLLIGTENGAALLDQEAGVSLLSPEPVRALTAGFWPSEGEVRLDLWELAFTLDLDYEENTEVLEQVQEALRSGELVGPVLRSIVPELIDDDEILQEMILRDFGYAEIDWSEVALIATNQAVLTYGRDGEPSLVLDRAVEDVVLDSNSGLVYLLERQDVLVSGWDGEAELVPARLPDQQNIVSNGRIHGLALSSLPGDYEHALIVLTDAGLSIFTDGHFEHLKLPAGDASAEARHFTAFQDIDGESSWHIATPSGVRSFDKSAVSYVNGRVRDIQTAEAWGLTFAAIDGWNGLWAIDHADGEAVPFASLEASCLALDSAGNLIATDGFEVVRFEVGSTTWRTLFYADPTPMPGFERSRYGPPIKDLVVDPDGTIWALSGGSVFRWRDGDEEPEEFAYSVDPARFPSKTWTMASLVRGPDGRLYSFGSNETHLASRGERMSGGVVVFDEETDSFVRHVDDLWSRTSNALFWMHSTDVGDDISIVSTPGGFVVINDGVLRLQFEDVESYQTLQAEDPRLWMGTEGVHLGDDAWLFGCARGLVVYQDGVWFAADRLDRMLPDQELGLYGSRHVYDVELDPQGRLYVGTVQGLMIYSGGLDTTKLLMEAGQPAAAASDFERNKLRDQADVLLAGVADSDDPVATRLRELIRSRDRIEAMTRVLDMDGRHRVARANPGRGESGIVRSETLDQELKRELAAYNRQLREIEFSDPVLGQMLELKPLDLAAIARRLPEGVTVLQLMPSRQTLYLNVVSATGNRVREVEVDREVLFARCMEAARLFRESVEDLARGFTTTGSGGASDPEAKARRRAELLDHLAWIYDHAMRPVEHDLADSDLVLISLAGALTQVPPAAWLRRDGERQEFAVERMTLGLLTDLHKIEIGIPPGLMGTAESLVVGDPDNTLTGARNEARTVHGMLGSVRELLIGDEASFDRISQASDAASIVHFATHGVVDVAKPVESHLVLAGGEKMMVYDICTLPLDLTDLAVLSACVSGVGESGLAYGSLASAFLNAGVPLTVATLWKVSDRWSEQLMKDFYGKYLDAASAHEALALAQRAMIASDTELSPAAWAGYVVFGMPQE